MALCCRLESEWKQIVDFAGRASISSDPIKRLEKQFRDLLTAAGWRLSRIFPTAAAFPYSRGCAWRGDSPDSVGPCLDDGLPFHNPVREG
jgi:hypothetical protein